MHQSKNFSWRLIVAFIISVTGHIALGYFLKRTDIANTFFVYFTLFAAYIYLNKQTINQQQLVALLIGSIVLRCLWLPAFPQLSDDYARFVWDGRLLASGHNPYLFLPSQIIKSGFPANMVNHPLYEALNSQEYYTCYPPLLQAIFAISSVIFPHNLMGNLIVLRSFTLFAEAGSLLLMYKLLPIFNIDRKAILLYALNPLVIAELSGNFHFEAIVIFFLLASLYCLYVNRWIWSALLFAMAVSTKLVPLIFLPLLWAYLDLKKGFQYCFLVLAFFMLSWLPFLNLQAIHQFWLSVKSFFVESEFNASIYYLVRAVVQYFENENMIQINGPLLSIFSGLVIFGYAISKFNRISFTKLPQYFIVTLFIYLAFTTTVHPWYITPLIALCVFTNKRFPIIWSAAIFLSYYSYHQKPFEESTPLLFIEYTLVAAAYIYDVYSKRLRSNITI